MLCVRQENENKVRRYIGEDGSVGEGSRTPSGTTISDTAVAFGTETDGLPTAKVKAVLTINLIENDYINFYISIFSKNYRKSYISRICLIKLYKLCTFEKRLRPRG